MSNDHPESWQIFASLADARYIVDAYVEADDLLRQFDATDRNEALIAAAAALCRGLAKLENDREFWVGLDGFCFLPKSEQDRTLSGLEDIDALIGLERRILRDGGLPEDAAAALAGEAGRAVRDVREWPDDRAFRRVKEVVRSARKTACLRASRGFESQETRRFPGLRRVMRVTGGVVVITVDAAAAVGALGAPSPAAAVSILAGIGLAGGGLRPAAGDRA